ncbi:MAG: hypothetical protein IKR11_04700 [Solobacterium sp.]|nr:hypothetical protein [Solobacterium sp.]
MKNRFVKVILSFCAAMLAMNRSVFAEEKNYYYDTDSGSELELVEQNHVYFDKEEYVGRVFRVVNDYELNLVDPDGEYPTIHEVVQLEVIDAR